MNTPVDKHLKWLKQLSTFTDIGKAVTSSLDIKEVLNIVMGKIKDLLSPKNWSLLLVDEEKNELYFETVVGEGADRIKNLRLKIGEGIAGWVAREGVPLLVPDVNNDPRFTKKVDDASRFATKSVICVPIISKGRVLGVIELINRAEEGSFKEEDLAILTTLADFTAIAIENAKYFQKVQELTITDDLTGLYNSRYLHHFMDYEIERTKRYGTNISMIFIDMDGFKEVNDVYGHLCGSKVLVEVAGVIISNIRTIDMACRYGGDEFVIVLPQILKPHAAVAAEKLRNIIKDSIFLKEEGHNIHLTASFGVASLPEDTGDKLELIHLADQAMYMIKNSNKNGVAIAKKEEKRK
ncbi:MAG: hypothetical protein A2073_05980 [Deltaproteobacteria bacterium GWC2_42_11]|nr:MAG: hypothetical protein A2073_05980 [Deltaproteobacteria bacterium GWC2_42_11]